MSADLPTPVVARHVEVILVGDFNPAIFVPLWFETHGLLPAGSAAGAEDVLVTAVISRFAAGDLFVQVTREEMLLRLVDAAGSSTVRDLAVGAMNLLVHTPVDEVQVVRHWHLASPRPPAWEDLVPLARWQAGEPDAEASLVELTVEVKRRSGRAHTLCSVSPSDSADDGVYLVVADRHVLTSAGGSRSDAAGAAPAVDVLDKEWEPAAGRAAAAAARTLAVLMPGTEVEANW